MMGTTTDKQTRLSSPIPADYQNTESFRNLSDQEELNPPDVVPENRLFGTNFETKTSASRVMGTDIDSPSPLNVGPCHPSLNDENMATTAQVGGACSGKSTRLTFGCAG
jgi:hypothetical protein